MKRLLFWLIYISNIHKFLRYIHRHKLTILLYHGVEPRINKGIYDYQHKFITPECFECQIRYLKNNYNILSLDEAIEILINKKFWPLNSLVITFDDGYKNLYNFAYPTIKNHRVPATVFLSTDFINKKIPLWIDRLEYAINMGARSASKSTEDKIKIDRNLRCKLKALPEKEKLELLKNIEAENGKSLNNSYSDGAYSPLSWEEIQEMEKGNIFFGAHTKTHPILTKISKEQAESEIKGSKNELQAKITKISTVFSYPNGQKDDFNQETETLVKSCGFQAALTTLPGFNDSASNTFALKRLTMDNTDDFPAFIATISGVKFFLQKMKNYAKRS